MMNGTVMMCIIINRSHSAMKLKPSGDAFMASPFHISGR